MQIGTETITRDDMPSRQMYNPYHLQQTIADLYNQNGINGMNLQGQINNNQPAPMDTQDNNGGRQW